LPLSPTSSIRISATKQPNARPCTQKMPNGINLQVKNTNNIAKIITKTKQLALFSIFMPIAYFNKIIRHITHP
jgi:hypothetical protein